jgi:hypothetical protein
MNINPPELAVVCLEEVTLDGRDMIDCLSNKHWLAIEQYIYNEKESEL